MKRISALLILAVASLTSFAQKDTALSNQTATDSISKLIAELEKRGMVHFTFKDIPLDGPLLPFVAKLKKQGFTVVKTTAEDAILSGKFTGNQVRLLVQATPREVYGVTVSFKKQATWQDIKTEYQNMKLMLTSKYGPPSEIMEKFEPPYYENSGVELFALGEGNCTYTAMFGTNTGNGMIKLWISSEANLVINYVDTLNFLLIHGEAYKDL